MRSLVYSHAASQGFPDHPLADEQYGSFIGMVVRWLNNAVQQVKVREEMEKLFQELVNEKEKHLTEKDERIREKDNQLAKAVASMSLLKQNQAQLIDARKQPIPASHWGSVTRIEMWDKLVESQNVIDHAPVIGGSQPATTDLQQDLLGINPNEWTSESDMYEPLISVLRDFLTRRDSPAIVVDTHSSTTFRADLSVSIYGDDRVLYGLYYFIQWKFMKAKAKLDSSDTCGKIVDYFHQARKAQPHRTQFVAILSNFENTWVFLATYDRDGFRIKKALAKSLADATVYADEHSLEQLSARVPPLHKCIHGESMGYHFLATTRHSFLLSLPIPTDRMTADAEPDTWRSPLRFTSKNFALKIKHGKHRMDAIKREVQILKNLNKACLSIHIPELVWSPPDRPELGIVPVGRPIDFRQSANISRNIVEGLIAGLKYLHGQEIVHRDIRPSNLVLDEQNNVVIIDYETALLISAGKEVEYFGGFICWPKRVLESDQARYLPRKSDDLRAAILLVLHLLFPSWFDNFYVSNIRPGKKNDRTTETNQLLTLWDNIERSVIWSQFVVVAEEENYDELVKMSEVFCHV